MQTPINEMIVNGFISALLTKSVEELWDLAKRIDVGAIVLEQEGFKKIRGSLKMILRQSGRSDLLTARNEQLDKYFRFYANETNKLALGSSVRVGYTHQACFIPTIAGCIELNNVKASQHEDYDVDEALGILGYRKAAENFRLKRGDKMPFPGSAVRVSDWIPQEPLLRLSLANYTDQFVTNQKEIVDTPIGEILRDTQITIPPYLMDHALRSLNSKDGKLFDFSKSNLANTIGIASTVITSDGYLVLPKRNEKVHFQSGYEGCSVSGVLEWSQGLLVGFANELKHQLTSKEGPQEILLDPKRIEVHPLAFAREFERAGKPQFFFHTWTDERLPNFVDKWSKSDQPKTEFDSIRWFQIFEPGMLREPNMAISQAMERLVVLLNSDSFVALKEGYQVILSEELRANLFYLLAFLTSMSTQAFPKHWLASAA